MGHCRSHGGNIKTVMTTLSPTQKRNDGQSLRFRWTVDSFYRAIAADIFDEPKRLELIHGDLWEKEPVNPPHASLTRRIARLIRSLLEPNFLVLEEKPLRLATDGEPVPDVYVARGSEEDFEERHPTNDEAVLVIEVADSSADRDTGEKALLYAQAGITDYWVSVVGTRRLLVFRDPTPSGYPDPVSLTEDDVVSPLAAPEITIAVRDLVARVSSPETRSAE